MTNMSRQPKSRELKEAVKRFCRTEQAADNLVEYILAWHQSELVRARIDELIKLMYQDMSLYNNEAVRERQKQLHQEKESRDEQINHTRSN